MQLTLHLTKACNLRCRYCYYADFPGGKMDFQTALGAGRQVLDLKHPHLAVTFFGGEPLLVKELIRKLVPAITKLCNERAISVNFKIPTNGLLLDESFLEFCEQNAVFLSLSIDGNEECQQDRVQVDDSSSFNRSVDALKLLAERATTFATYSVITPRTADRVAEGIKFLYQHGSRILITAIDYGGDWTRKSLNQLQKEYEKLAEFYIARTEQRRHFYLSMFDSKISAHTRPSQDEDTVCKMGINQLSVGPDGSYFPCIQFVEKPEFRVGSVLEGLDQEACQKHFSCSSGKNKECAGCGIADRCSNHCACVSWQTTGTLDGIAPINCEHERILIPIADKVAARLYRRRVPLFINKHYNPDYDLLRTVEDVVKSNLHHNESVASSRS